MTIQNPPPTLESDTGKKHFSKSMRDIVAKCLVKDPSKRPSATQLLEHKFFKVRHARICMPCINLCKPLCCRRGNQWSCRRSRHSRGNLPSLTLVGGFVVCLHPVIDNSRPARSTRLPTERCPVKGLVLKTTSALHANPVMRHADGA